MQPVKSLHPFKGTPLKVKEVHLKAQTLRVESTSSIETPLFSQGEVAKNPFYKHYSSQNIQLLQFFLYNWGPFYLVLGNLNIKIPLIDVPISSDIVHDTMLTTKDLHQNVEELHVGADPDDNTTNSRVPEVFTSTLKTSILPKALFTMLRKKCLHRL